MLGIKKMYDKYGGQGYINLWRRFKIWFRFRKRYSDLHGEVTSCMDIKYKCPFDLAVPVRVLNNGTECRNYLNWWENSLWLGYKGDIIIARRFCSVVFYYKGYLCSRKCFGKAEFFVDDGIPMINGKRGEKYPKRLVSELESGNVYDDNMLLIQIDDKIYSCVRGKRYEFSSVGLKMDWRRNLISDTLYLKLLDNNGSRNYISDDIIFVVKDGMVHYWIRGIGYVSYYSSTDIMPAVFDGVMHLLVTDDCITTRVPFASSENIDKASVLRKLV